MSQDIGALPFTVSPSVSEIVFHAEENGDCWIQFVAWYPSEEKHAVIKLSLGRLIEMRSGEFSSGIWEIKPSEWLERTNAKQRNQFPDSPDNLKDLRHFCVGGHDVGYEFLCRGFTWQKVREL